MWNINLKRLFLLWHNFLTRIGLFVPNEPGPWKLNLEEQLSKIELILQKKHLRGKVV